MIVFTSDHGDMQGDHNLWRKTYAYESSARIPMIVRLPKNMRNSVQRNNSAPVTLQDIMPTVLEVVGAQIPDEVDGKSMLSMIIGNDSESRKYLHGEHSTVYSPEQEMQYLTDGKYKYIWFPRMGTERLFDLGNDPHECEDLSECTEYATLLLKWRKRLIEKLEPRGLNLTNGDQLVCQKGKPPIVSPKYHERMKDIDLFRTGHKSKGTPL